MSGPEVDLLIIEQMDPEHPRPSGIESIVADVSRFATDLRIGIVGVTARPGRLGRWRKIPYQGRPVWFFPVARLPLEPSGLQSHVPNSLRVAFGLAVRRPRWVGGLVHVHRAEYGALLSLLPRGRYVQFLHNDSTGLLGGASDSLWRRLAPVYRFLERRSLARAAGVGVFNASDAPRLRGIRPDVTTLRTWFDPDIFYADPTGDGGTGRVEVFWAGRLESQKDPVLAVEVAAAAGPSVHLTLAGTGSLADEIARAADDRGIDVSMLGAIPKEQVAERMRAADVFLLTSHYEGSPTVIAEAMACGLPVVATATADPDRMVTDGWTGFSVAERTAPILADFVVRAAHLDRTSVRRAGAGRSSDRLIPAMLAVGGRPTRVVGT